MESGFNEHARKTKERREALEARLLALAAERGREAAIEVCAGELDITVKQLRNRLHQWNHKYPTWAVKWEELGGGRELKRAKAMLEGFPSTDFLKFREMCCAYYDSRQKRYVRAVNNWYQQDAYAQLQTHNRLLVILPPGHIKSTFFGQEYPTWKIMGNRNFRSVLIQKNADEAKKQIAVVQQRLSDWEYYRFLQESLVEQGQEPIINPLDAWFHKNPFRPSNKRTGVPWGAYEFMVSGRTSGEKDYTMEAKGVGGQIQGVRADLITLDDIQDPELAVKSPADSISKLRWFKNVILGRVTEYQQVVVLANYFSPDDFAHKLLEANPEFAVVEYPALIENDKGEQVPLCPEFWTTEALEMKRKEVGQQTWFYTWMQESGSFDEQTFKRDVLEGSKNEEIVIGDVPHDVTDIFLGCDPAIAASGHCAMVIWGLNRRTQQRYLIDVFNETGMRNWDNVIAQLVEYARAYHPRVVILEMNNTQGSLANNPALVRQIRSLGGRLQTYQTVTGLGARAEQTNFDITTIGGLFDAGLITLPAGGTFDEVRRIEDYIDQLVAWRTDDEGHSIKHLKRDMVMATLFAESEAFVVANKPAEPPRQHGIRQWGRTSWGKRKEPPDTSETFQQTYV